MTAPRILFAGNFHWNAGSSHTIAGYVGAAAAVGCAVGVSAELSRVDGRVPDHLPMIDDLRWATHLAFVFEGRQFLTDEQLDRCQRFPRARRIVIDPDGHWGEPVQVGEDTSWGGYPHQSWQELYRRLSDRVLQPRIDGTPMPGVERFSYFGMPEIVHQATDLPAPDAVDYQLQYIGNNWWRWQGLTDLLDAVRPVLPAPGRIRVAGQWWDGPPCAGHACATGSRPGWLVERGIEVAPSVPFGRVVHEMARGAVTPVLARPLLAAVQLLTPRMFETLASGSLPVLAADLGYLSELWGNRADQFVLRADPAATVDRMLRDHPRARRDLAAIQRHMYSLFSYRQVLAELVALLR